MKETYKIEKLEDMPKYVPIIFIKDNGIKNSKPRMFGLNIHDSMVIESNGTQLYYYNLQCGESSHECSDFRFIKREATCYNDEFYSHFCQNVDLEQLISDYTKQVRKEVVEFIDKCFEMQKYESIWINPDKTEFSCDVSYAYEWWESFRKILLDQRQG